MTTKKTKSLFPIATALRAGLEGYSFKTLKADFVAGLIVSLIALPLSMALSIAVGLPPQHGLYTAIVAGVAAALLGGSATQVSGPTAAFVVILAPIVTQYGLHGIIWCQIMAGVTLIALGTARLGQLIHRVPHSVTLGFTAGIAVTIGTLALNDFLGLGIEKFSGHYIEKATLILSRIPEMHGQEFAVGLATLLVIIFLPARIAAKLPSPVAGIALGALIAWLFSQQGVAVDALDTRFFYDTPEGGQGAGIPPYPPVFHLPGGVDSLFKIPSFEEFRTLLMPAFVIAALAGLESLLSATVADKMTYTKHDPNAELNGIGIANILSGLAAGIPATGTIARTATNIHAGAKTPFASVFHALLLLLYMVTLAPYISIMPMASLAALLLMVAWRMSHVHEFIETVKKSPKNEVIVLLSTFLLTVFVDMVAGVTIGIVLSFLLPTKDKTHA